MTVPATIGRSDIASIRRTRRRPRRTQFDYLHLRRLVEDLERALGGLDASVRDVLDVFCGTRPYEDLLPEGSTCVGLDIDDHYGCADVVTDEFLPFEDASFDLVMSIEAFYYVPDPVAGIAELRRVLRPGGTALLTVPLVWEYDRTILEHRYTGPELAALFEGWDRVDVVENGGRGVSWATLTGSILHGVEREISWPLRRALRPAFAFSYLGVNCIGAMFERLDKRLMSGPHTLPMNLLVSARRPRDAG